MRNNVAVVEEKIKGIHQKMVIIRKKVTK